MISINGKNIEDYHLLLDAEFRRLEKHATRNVEFHEIAGVDGEIVSSNSNYKGIRQDYPLYMDMTNSKEQATICDVVNWLNTLDGWVELVYDFDNTYFRLGYHCSEFNIENSLTETGKVILTFALKPYKWLLTGQTALSFNANTTLINPEPCPSLPLIKLFGTGSSGISINGVNYTAAGVSGWIAFDCESMQAYTTNGNANHQINFYPFPTLKPGSNSIKLTGNTTKVEIMPRWRRLI